LADKWLEELMARNTVEIRELRTRLGSYLRRVKSGGTLVITERGKPIGRMMPIALSVHARTHELMRAGLVAWSGRKLASTKRSPSTRGKRSVAEVLLENRE
jgi:prevent-host-death family protein